MAPNTGRKKSNKVSGFFASAFLKLVFVFVVVFGVVKIVSVQVSVAEKREQLDVLNAKADAYSEENEELSRLVNLDDDREYIAQVAMDDYGYAIPGETRYYDISRN